MALQSGKTKLVIITSVLHYDFKGQLYACGPYTYEIEPWARLFEEVFIAAPCRRVSPPNDCLPFTSANISIIPQKESGGRTIKKKLFLIASIPKHLLGLIKAMRKGDVIQIRCPCSLGLLGAFLAPFFSEYIFANYAGQWNGFVGEPFSSRLQRFILRSWWWRNGLVTVYGEWPNQPKQIISFFTSTMTASQVQAGKEAALQKQLALPVQILFVGRLSVEKGVDILLQAAGILNKQNVPFKLSIIGDGYARECLEQMVKQMELDDHVQFIGAIPYAEVMSWYEKAHVLVLPSQSEGWGKVLLEAMCYGVICVATDTGPIPWMLKDKGFVVPYGDVEGLAARLRKIVEDPAIFPQFSRAANKWACQSNFSIEGVQEATSRLLQDGWNYGIRK